MRINLGDFQSIKPHLRTRLLSCEHHEIDGLAKRHIVSDLFQTFYVLLDASDNDIITWNVTPDLVEMWNVTIDDLDRTSKENTSCKLTKMSNVLQAMIGSEPLEDTGIPMYIVTNESSTYGASAIFDERIQKKLSELYPSGCMVIPSSVHEMLCLDTCIPVKELKNMVESINRDVTKNDTLSDNVFFLRDGVLVAV